MEFFMLHPEIVRFGDKDNGFDILSSLITVVSPIKVRNDYRGHFLYFDVYVHGQKDYLRYYWFINSAVYIEKSKGYSLLTLGTSKILIDYDLKETLASKNPPVLALLECRQNILSAMKNSSSFSMGHLFE
jgi:hypothetical protein